MNRYHFLQTITSVEKQHLCAIIQNPTASPQDGSQMRIEVLSADPIIKVRKLYVAGIMESRNTE